jgi:hypothetical protein
VRFSSYYCVGSTLYYLYWITHHLVPRIKVRKHNMPQDTSHVLLAADDSFLIECWTWYSLGCLIILLRYAVRLRTVGFRGFEGDDYIAFLVGLLQHIVLSVHRLTANRVL